MGKTRTVTLTDRQPVRIDEDLWPTVARARRWDGEHESQANRRWTLIVRQHADGRTLVYGTHSTQWRGERDVAAGRLLDWPAERPAPGPDTFAPAPGLIEAVHEVADRIGAPELADEAIGDLPPETI